MQPDKNELTSEQTNDINWLAFCYVSNEMSPEEHQLFEERLLEDQLAREAVASAVELTQTVAGIETVEQSVQLPAHRISVWQRATWIATAIAACLAFVVGYQFVSQILKYGDDESPGVAENGSATEHESGRLAEAWLDATDESPELFFASSSNDNVNGPLSENPAASELSHPLLESEPVETPDWMVAAVSGMFDEASDMREQ